jgi:hypothetical protein
VPGDEICVGPPPASPAGTAREVLARTSEPPCFSVIPIPSVMPDFSRHGRNAGSQRRDRMPGSSLQARSGAAASVATAARVIVTGHMWPFSTWATM